MTRRASKYTRCEKCRELVIDVENCANCAARAENPFRSVRAERFGKRGSPTLDIQERNLEELS